MWHLKKLQKFVENEVWYWITSFYCCLWFFFNFSIWWHVYFYINADDQTLCSSITFRFQIKRKLKKGLTYFYNTINCKIIVRLKVLHSKQCYNDILFKFQLWSGAINNGNYFKNLHLKHFFSTLFDWIAGECRFEA